MALSLNKYQRKAVKFAVFPEATRIHYPAMGLAGEAGEICNIVKKLHHGKKIDRNKIIDEIGDCLWYLAALANDLGVDLGHCAGKNIEKLTKRKAEGSLIDREKRNAE